MLDTELCPQHCGFSIVRKNRNHCGDGVAVLLADNVRFAVHSNLCCGSIETVWLQLFPGCKQSLLFCCAYRHPSQMAFSDDLLQECENALVGKTQKLLIVGDLNSNLLQPSLPQTHVLVAMMKHLNLTELVGQPTGVTGSSSSQIDVILTNVTDDFRDSTVVPCSCTDHYLTLSHYYARGVKTGAVPKVVLFRNYLKLDMDLLSDILSDDITWNDVFSLPNVDDYVHCFTLVLQGLLDILVPLRRLHVHNGGSDPWVTTPCIIAARRLQDRLHHNS